MRSNLGLVWTLLFLVVTGSSVALAQEDFTFDVSEYEAKPFEFKGYVELNPEYSLSNEDGALYQLQFFDEEEQKRISRLTGTVELDGRYRKGIAALTFKTHSEVVWDYLGEDQDHSLYEGYLTLQQDPTFALDVGKKAMRWGKGYAWNPVAFVERAKDAGDPDLSREGFWMVVGDWIYSFDGPLQTLAITPLILPNKGNINDDFGLPGHTNLAGKVYLLYKNTDIDFMFLSNGSRTSRWGMDFSKNLAPQFEIHGEFAYVTDADQRTINPDCTSEPNEFEDKMAWLLGLRYRTQTDITLIAEYYYNGLGNRKKDQEHFYECVHRAWDTGDLDLVDKLPLGEDLDRGPFTRPNPLRRYGNLRAWWEEPYQILYFTPGIQVLYGFDDNSYSIAPELNYTGINDLELRLRATFPFGDSLTEWGEKPNKYKIDLRVRYYF